MKTKHSSDSDSVELVALLRTPIFYFQLVLTSLTTLTLTPLLVKTRLKKHEWKFGGMRNVVGT